MIEKDLKKMSRSELLEMLIVQIEDNNSLKNSLEQAEEQLRNRRIMIDNAGSIAEASLQLHEIFEVAEAAAKEYLENIQILNTRQEEVCKKMEEKARKKAEDIMAEAQEYSNKVRSEADMYWRQVYDKSKALLKEHETLRALILSVEGKETI